MTSMIDYLLEQGNTVYYNGRHSWYIRGYEAKNYGSGSGKKAYGSNCKLVR